MIADLKAAVDQYKGEIAVLKAKINELEGHLSIVKTALVNAQSDLAEREAGIKQYAEKCIQWK